ncbi:MAG: IS1634 family transposase [Mycobacteriales bacterium]
MTRRSGAIHVARVVRKYTTKAGPAESVSHLLRRSYRADGKIKHETVANVSALPAPALDALRAALAGKPLLVAGEGLEITRSLPHGHLAAVAAQGRLLGLPDLLGPPCRSRDIAAALVLSRVVRPASKLATARWWADTTIGADFGLVEVGTDEVYAAMDWLLDRQDAIEAVLARRHLAGAANPAGLAYFDLTSAWVEGRHCPLAARGYSREGKKGLPQIEYGLLTDGAGRPVAVRVFPGNTADPSAFTAIVEVARDRFGLRELVMVGDRGMITSARIDALRELGGLGWLTALRAPAIAALAADDGPLQLSLLDQADLAEFAHPDYPGERLVAARNPALAAERARKRTELLAATAAALAPIVTAVDAGRLRGADKIGLRVGRVLGRHKMAKHLAVTITDTTLAIARDEASIAAEAALDGIYVLRTTVGTDLSTAGVVTAYKNLANVERDFRHLKVDDLDLRPIHHHLEDRVRGHVLVCFLAGYLVWHLRRALAPLTFTDEAPPGRDNPVAPARRSAAAAAKAAAKTSPAGEPVRGFRELLDHLGTLTRNHIRASSGTGVDTEFELLATPTPTQRRAFELLGAPIPRTLK